MEEIVNKQLMLMLCILLTPLVVTNAFADTDYACLNDCSSRYTYQYCQQACSYGNNKPQGPQGFYSGYQKGVLQQQEIEMKKLELEQKKLELEKMRRQLQDEK